MSFSPSESLKEIRNLEKTVTKIIPQVGSQPNPETDDFRGLPFWLWDIPRRDHSIKAREKRGNCCFNHRIGLPKKDGVEQPIFPWQRTIFDAYEEHKYNWILKATGLGVTEFTLRYILWKATHSSIWERALVGVITGPRIDLARQSINRMRDMIMYKYPLSDLTQEHFIINGVTVYAFPSNHLDTFRGQPSVKFVFLDEADFFRKTDQYDVRDTSERYIGKSDIRIVMVSTPNQPGGLMERIQNEEPSIYNKLFLDYRIGIGTMFTQEQIDANKESPSFRREYDLQYLGEIGNIFHIDDIEYAIHNLGEQYNPDDETITTNQMITRTMGIDPGFGSSMFGISILQHEHDDSVSVIYADHIERGSMTECLDLVLKLAQKHRVMKLYVDSSAAGFIKDLKREYKEYDVNDYHITLKDHPEILDSWIKSMKPRVVPVSFRMKHEDMLRNLEIFLQKKVLRINKKFDKLQIALRTAVSKGEDYRLDKERTSHDDILDSVMLGLLGFYGH